MGRYPIDISEEENAKLKYPFLPAEEYESIYRSPEGTVIMLRKSDHPIPKDVIDRMVRINQEIARRVEG